MALAHQFHPITLLVHASGGLWVERAGFTFFDVAAGKSGDAA